MSIDGLWTAEFYGLQGWENTGVAVLQNGSIFGGGRHHYSTGEYQAAGDDIRMTVTITYHGTPRVLFGSSDKTLSLEFAGKHNGDVITGNVNRAGNREQSLIFRLTKRVAIP